MAITFMEIIMNVKGVFTTGINHHLMVFRGLQSIAGVGLNQLLTQRNWTYNLDGTFMGYYLHRSRVWDRVFLISIL
jgi:hypothetical protein